MKRGFFYSLGLSRKTYSTNFAPILAILILSVVTITQKFYFGAAVYVMMSWLIFFLFESGKITRANHKLKSVLSLGFLYVVICAVYQLLGISSASIEYCVARPFLYFAPVVALMIIDRCDNEQQVRFLFHFLALAIAINIADNIRLTNEYGIENIAYQKLAGLMKEEGITGLNLGGSMFVNMCVFYSCLMFMAFLKSNKGAEKFLFLIYTGISAYFIIFCTLKASAIVLLLISIVLMYISFRSKEHTGLIILSMSVFVGFVFLFLDNIIYFLTDMVGSERIAERLMVFTSEGDVEDSSLMGRGQLWLVSLRSWLGSLGSFFFGIGDHDWTKALNTAATGIGSHSDLLDVLGRYGILGAFILYSSIKIYYDYLKNKYGNSFKWEIISFFIILILMGLTKKIIAPQQPIVIFILLPLTLKYILVQKNKL